MKIFQLAILLLLCSCCKKETSYEQVRFYDDGRAKPVVALLPVIDNTEKMLSWNISEELTHDIRHKILQKEKLFLISDKKAREIYFRIPDYQSPFLHDYQWIKNYFPSEEFAVFIELIKHDRAPLDSIKKDASMQLHVAARIRIFDLRGDTVQVVLQEIVENHNFLPKNRVVQVSWKEKGYAVSPIGLAHSQLIKEIATRIEDYILIAKSR